MLQDQQKQLMLQKLNYYSRYNRIKEHYDIYSLYNLIAGLNLDLLVSDQFSISLPSPSQPLDELCRPLQTQKPKRRKKKTKTRKNNKVIFSTDGQERTHKRHSSCEPLRPKPNHYLMRYPKDFDSLEQQSQDEEERNHSDDYGDDSPKIYQGQTPEGVNYPQDKGKSSAENVKREDLSLSGKKRSNQSSHKSDYLQQGNFSDAVLHHHKFDANQKAPSVDNIGEQSKDVKEPQYPSIQSMDAKNCLSHSCDDEEPDINSCQAQQAVNEPQNAAGGGISYNHREEDIYSEDFMGDINKLIKVNEEDRKSIDEKIKQPETEYLEHSKSLVLERMHDSDIEVEQRQHNEIEDDTPNPQFRIEEQSLPTTNKKNITDKTRHNDLQDQEKNEYFAQDQKEEGDKIPQNEELDDGDYEGAQQTERYEQQPQIRQNNMGDPIHNLHAMEEAQCQGQGNRGNENYAPLERLQHRVPTVSSIIPQETGYSEKEHNLINTATAMSGSPTNRKSFKRVIRSGTNPTTFKNESPLKGNAQTSQNSPLNFKQTKKLNPRLVTSTIVNDPQRQPRKLNFKKALIRGQENRQKTNQSIESIKQRSLQKSKESRQKNPKNRKLLQAFFQQN